MAFYLQQVSWTSLYLGPLPWLALSVLESLFVAGGAVLIALAYRWVPRASTSRWVRLVWLPLLVAGLWCVREAATGSIPYGGFPWGRAALSQSESPFADVVSWVGSTGLGFIMVAIVAGVIEWVRLRGWQDLRSAIPVAALALVALLRAGLAHDDDRGAPSRQRAGQRPGGLLRRAGARRRARGPARGDGADPRRARHRRAALARGRLRHRPDAQPDVADIFDDLSEQLDAPVVLNTVTTRDDEFFNTSLLWRAGEGAVDSYDKRNPVPFGEYIPDRSFWEPLAPDLIGLIQRGYTPGTNAPVFDLGSAVTGLAICFDVIYDELIWEGARDGAELYMFQTNNADFTGTDENQQQLAIARLRAIETGRSVVNISTVGTSQVIDPTGRTIDALPAYEQGAMVTDVELREGLTPSVVLGGTVPFLIVAVSLGGLIAAGALARRRSRREVGSGD